MQPRGARTRSLHTRARRRNPIETHKHTHARSHRHAYTHGPRVAATRAWLQLVPPAGLARVGRRCHLDVPHGQRGMGCAIFAHVRGRRRRRHLRHRRQRRRCPKLHLLRRRVGEHRRRCAAGLSRWGVVGGYWMGVLRVLDGYLGTKGWFRGTEEYSREYSWVLRGSYGGATGLPRGTKGTKGVLRVVWGTEEYHRGTQVVLRGTKGVLGGKAGVLEGKSGVLGGTHGVFAGCLGVSSGYLERTRGVLEGY